VIFFFIFFILDFVEKDPILLVPFPKKVIFRVCDFVSIFLYVLMMYAGVVYGYIGVRLKFVSVT